MIYLASDHGGFKYKNKLKKVLSKSAYEIKDVGNHEFDKNDDYPDFAIKAVKGVLKNPEKNRAILFCKNGVGVSITANKFNGIRATLSWSKKHAKTSREDDNTNVLTIPTNYISFKKVRRIVKIWLETEFSENKRHIRRLNKIKGLEQ